MIVPWCVFGIAPAVGSLKNHEEGHRIGDRLKGSNRQLFYSLAVMMGQVSELAKFGLDEAFAEGYALGMQDPTHIEAQLLVRSVSRHLDADPEEVRQA